MIPLDDEKCPAPSHVEGAGRNSNRTDMSVSAMPWARKILRPEESVQAQILEQ